MQGFDGDGAWFPRALPWVVVERPVGAANGAGGRVPTPRVWFGVWFLADEPRVWSQAGGGTPSRPKKLRHGRGRRGGKRRPSAVGGDFDAGEGRAPGASAPRPEPGAGLDFFARLGHEENMTADQVRKARARAPFQPFTIDLSDQRRFVIPQPDFLWVMPGGRTLGIADENGAAEIVDLVQVTSLELSGAEES